MQFGRLARCALCRSEQRSLLRRCCSDSNSFFGANCLDQTFIYNQAVGPVGFTADSLKAGAFPFRITEALVLLTEEASLLCVISALTFPSHGFSSNYLVRRLLHQALW